MLHATWPVIPGPLTVEVKGRHHQRVQPSRRMVKSLLRVIPVVRVRLIPVNIVDADLAGQGPTAQNRLPIHCVLGQMHAQNLLLFLALEAEVLDEIDFTASLVYVVQFNLLVDERYG